MMADSRYIKVGVGSSSRDIMLLNNLKRISYENGWTLQIWDDSISLFLLHESERCFPFADYGIILFKSMHMDIRTLMGFIREGSLEVILSSYEMPRAWYHALCSLSPANFFLSEKISNQPLAQRKTRKHLSREKRIVLQQIVCPLVWILIVILVDFILCVCCPAWRM